MLLTDGPVRWGALDDIVESNPAQMTRGAQKRAALSSLQQGAFLRRVLVMTPVHGVTGLAHQRGNACAVEGGAPLNVMSLVALLVEC